MNQKPDPSKERRRAWLACVLLAVIYFVVPVEIDTNTARMGVRVLVSLLTVGVVAWLVTGLVRRQLTAPTREARSLAHLAVALVAGLLAFALADYVIARVAPAQFVDLETRIDALYFALTTLTTVGYGDVHAQGQLARVLVSVQLAFSIGVIATGASLLVKQFTARP
ncbi:two pore domain potassium channel family protein [Micromonospora craterilacus]|uniref:Two pore domain potassium channel family protein n=1 Tax=Micromonospora craterilacus TaxID=1655439 RepID=A0A2W2EZJ9_9ACTN|nr:potassium channel family protein [Micromonospora craterilacus]PZG19010.1 two pore domain potassium channel family protein [Micromonospora craterilacus]